MSATTGGASRRGDGAATLRHHGAVASVGIIGGGPAGLALACRLRRQGHAVTLFELEPRFGGLAAASALGDLEVERYYHFLCRGDRAYLAWLDELGLGDRLRWTTTRLGFCYQGRYHSLATPLDLLRCSALTLPGRVRYGLFTARCAALEDWRRLDGIPARDWLVHNLGFDTYHVLWHPLLAMKFHEHHAQISAAWIWHRIHRVARSRGAGLQRERFGHLVGGTPTLIDELVRRARALGCDLRAGVRVTRVTHDGGAVTGVETDAGALRCERVVSTVPLPVFCELVPGLPPRYLAHLRSIDYLGVVCVRLRLREPFSDSYWLNVNDPRVPFNGCIEYTHLNPGATPDGSTLLYVPYYVDPRSARYRASDAETIEDTLHALAAIQPRFGPERVRDASVARDRYAQVVCRVGFGLLVPPHETPIAGLHLVESSQLYPADRSISATLELVDRVAASIGPAS